MRPSDPSVSYLKNITSEVEALEYVLPESHFTGKNDLTQLGSFISWNNEATVDMWPIDAPISGTDDWGQFQPFLDYYTHLSTFSEDFMRTLDLIPVGK